MKLNALFVRSLVGASLLAGATLLPATSALAQQADQGYVTLPAAQPSDSVGKTEVLEFFSYSCPHCAILEPKVEAWSKTLPDNVVLRRVPVAFNAGMTDLQKLYYTLEAMDRLDLHPKVFEAIHQKRERIFDAKTITAWAAQRNAAAHGEWDELDRARARILERDDVDVIITEQGDLKSRLQEKTCGCCRRTRLGCDSSCRCR